MLSATDFLPSAISTLTNFATSLLEYFGSGRISRLGISLRRGIVTPFGRKWKSTFARLMFSGESPAEPADSPHKMQPKNYAALGFLAPYFERLCLRSFTPAVSSAPRTM